MNWKWFNKITKMNLWEEKRKIWTLVLLIYWWLSERCQRNSTKRNIYKYSENIYFCSMKLTRNTSLQMKQISTDFNHIENQLKYQITLMTNWNYFGISTKRESSSRNNIYQLKGMNIQNATFKETSIQEVEFSNSKSITKEEMGILFS